MTRVYGDAASFRQALEARLKQMAGQRRIPLNTLRQKVVMERLLARLFENQTDPWRLKGGYAMELRLAGRARTTRDLDVATTIAAVQSDATHDRVRDALRHAAARDLGDFLIFAVASPGSPLAAEQAGGFRFGMTADLAGRRYAGFHLDVGLDADPTEPVDSLVCEDHLAFAGIAPARVAVVPRERQFAEKIHAYTRPWDDRENTRVKDLIDLLLLMDLGLRDSEVLGSVLRNVFDRRGSHGLPPVLQPPPASWATSFKQLSTQTGLAEPTLEEAYRRLSAFWERVREDLDGGAPPT